MTNLKTLRSRCKLICSTCYPDRDVLEAELYAHMLVPDQEYDMNFDRTMMICALNIVSGWVETSRSEGGSRSHGGISVSTDIEATKRNMRYWIRRYDFDATDFGLEESSIDNGSDCW
jgi:hypothetical protein